ncbi:MAG: sigma-70 family RNA polymerase sigma factor [Actinomycetota bacterium]
MSSREREFNDFYSERAGRLKRFALHLTADPAEAEDLTQEALLRAYRSWGRIQGPDPAPYVRRTLVNLHRNSIRHKVVERKHLRVEKPESTPSHDQRVEQEMRIARALRCLSPTQRAAVVLRFYEDLPQAEIADILDRPSER